MRGAPPTLVRRALADREPFPGGYGFAGEVDGTVVRDVLGRTLVYTERDDPSIWSYDPDELTAPDLVPAGHRRGPDGDERVWELPTYEPRPADESTVERLSGQVADAIDGSVDVDAPVAFSGGVDSAAIAARTDAPLYVAGFEDSHDVAAARSAADALDRSVTVVELDHDDLRRAVPEVVQATGRTNAMAVAIALPLYLVAERVAADGYDRLALGQGADELFGGYAKVANASDDPRVDASTVRGARRESLLTLPEQLERDVRALRAAGVDPVAPLLHDEVITDALRLPGDLLVDGDERKVAFRRAVDWVPDGVRFREKKAVQYGTYVSRELDRLARQNGFKRRMDHHVTKYVESITD